MVAGGIPDPSVPSSVDAGGVSVAATSARCGFRRRSDKSWPGGSISSVKDAVAAIGGNSSSEGGNLHLCWAGAVSPNHRRVGGRPYGGMVLPNPNYVGDNPTARHRYTLRTVAPPTVLVDATPATYVLCHWRMLPPRTETVLRCALLVCNMDNIPLRPAGPIHSSRRDWRLRKSLRDEPISIRHLHSTQTES